MESPSFVSKARTSLHSAAAKAERVLSDLKQPDRPDSDKTSPRMNRRGSRGVSMNRRRALRWRPPNIGTKHEWQDRLRNIRKRKERS